MAAKTIYRTPGKVFFKDGVQDGRQNLLVIITH